MIDGTIHGPSHDPWAVDGMERVHWGGRETTAAEVKYRIALKAYAETNPDHPAAKPNKPIDLDRFEPI
jgi:hypothetical protein